MILYNACLLIIQNYTWSPFIGDIRVNIYLLGLSVALILNEYSRLFCSENYIIFKTHIVPDINSWLTRSKDMAGGRSTAF